MKVQEKNWPVTWHGCGRVGLHDFQDLPAHSVISAYIFSDNIEYEQLKNDFRRFVQGRLGTWVY